MKNSEDLFLIEGARSYLTAKRAIEHYENEVQGKCRRLMAKYLHEYANALGIRVSEKDLKEFAWGESTWASVGAMLEKRSVFPGIGSWNGWCNLEWQIEEPRFWCFVGESYTPRKMAAHLFQRFEGFNKGSLWLREPDVGVYSSIKPEDAAVFEETLHGLWQQWIDLWKKAGGMKGVFK